MELGQDGLHPDLNDWYESVTVCQGGKLKAHSRRPTSFSGNDLARKAFTCPLIIYRCLSPGLNQGPAPRGKKKTEVARSSPAESHMVAVTSNLDLAQGSCPMTIGPANAGIDLINLPRVPLVGQAHLDTSALHWIFVL